MRAAIRDVNGGEVEIEGRVALAGPQLVAPLSGEACLAYSTRITRWVYDRRGGGSGRGAGHACRCTRFTIANGTGVAEVEPTVHLEIGGHGHFKIDDRGQDATLIALLQGWGLAAEKAE